MNSKIEEVKQILKRKNISALLIPSTDEFLNEYTPDELARLKTITGFTGSNGYAIITSGKEHYFFTDSRYILQAAVELGESFIVYDMHENDIFQWINSYIKENKLILNPKIFAKKFVEKLLESSNNDNLIIESFDELEFKLAKAQASAVSSHEQYAGKSRAEKIAEIKTAFSGEYLLISDPSSVSWLLNLRSNYINCNPTILAYMVLAKSGRSILFSYNHEFSNEILLELEQINIEVLSIDSIEEILRSINLKQISISPKINYWLFSLVKQKAIIESDPCEIAKSCKNMVEIAGMISCHIEDAKALRRALRQISEASNASKVLTELDVVKILHDERAKQKLFVEESFPAIVGFNSNGAIVHYKPSQESNKQIKTDGLLLIDSGGQYLNGTTDVTRTIAIGKPSNEQIRIYTLVLKGHIALASLVFPLGTCGHHIDVLARMYLWRNGLNYGHGTGHGVGSYLSVHEGPQSISPGVNQNALKPGMVVSIEPGYYKKEEFGIRIENLYLIKNADYENFLCFEPLTLVEFEEKLIDRSLLSEDEKLWIENYYLKIKNNL